MGIDDRQPRLREKLPAREHHDDDRRRRHENVSVHEPSEIADRQEDRAKAFIEMSAGNHIHADDPFGGALGGDDIGLAVAHHWDRAEEDAAVVEEPIRPAKLEEGVCKERRQPADLEFEARGAAAEYIRQIGEDGIYLVRRTEQCKAAADREH